MFRTQTVPDPMHEGFDVARTWHGFLTDGLGKLSAVATSGPWSCGGRWAAAADRLVSIQGIDADKFKFLVVRALRSSRKKGLIVLIFGQPDGGKSFLIGPLPKAFVAMIRKGQHETFDSADCS